MPEDMNPDTNFKVIDKRSPETQARVAEMPEADHIGDVNEMVLKPCPFCGGEGIICGVGHSTHLVKCRECQSSTGAYHHSPKEAHKAWNRRTPEPGTSVVRWVRYDGTPETLPKTRFVDDPRVICFFENRYVVFSDGYAVGTIWAHLPAPPEGMG